VNAHRGKIVALAIATAVAAATLVVAADGRSGPSPSELDPSAFAWVRPSALPPGWTAQRLPNSPARLPTPSGWHPSRGDAGTRTTIVKGPDGRIAGYLNATPRQGEESTASWDSFRVDHNRDEGERRVRLLASATGLRFRSGSGSCVLDSYVTTSGHRYREVACIVAGRTETTVVVGAAPPRGWDAKAPAIERAIDSFTT
jgi:hypothetical protein